MADIPVKTRQSALQSLGTFPHHLLEEDEGINPVQIHILFHMAWWQRDKSLWSIEKPYTCANTNVNRSQSKHSPLPEVLWWHTAPMTRARVRCQPCSTYCPALQALTLCFTLGPEHSPVLQLLVWKNKQPMQTAWSNVAYHSWAIPREEQGTWSSLELAPLQQTIHHLWRKLRKGILHFYRYQMSPTEVKYSFTTVLFETFYLHTLFQWGFFLMD